MQPFPACGQQSVHPAHQMGSPFPRGEHHVGFRRARAFLLPHAPCSLTPSSSQNRAQLSKLPRSD